ncbi:MAG: hypothetical protein A2Y64_03730 [Candidatus Coatesbacteria bacterium RBG_13_66_14]|uniref:Uncharacterized protein n=1 Tax=Candidatus Coatesbacteria bacterium RBG_13_66_14 TaxID=1817816 RepID=A0A1F5EWT9_9BACT|nr:MAG: hypothetical protein A2Y64_03730 [Candidatus Coatesbacteria bacterium RBG_13_66_14]
MPPAKALIPGVLLPILAALCACAPGLGPGGPLVAGRYAVEAPNDAWGVGDPGDGETVPEGKSALFVRRDSAEGEDELAYLECLYYDRYLDAEDWIRSVGAEERVLADLSDLLRLELTRLSPELEWIGTQPLTATDPALSVSWRFLDLKEQLHADSPAKTYNEVSLVLVGDEVHLVAFYCYDDKAEELAPEYEGLKGSLAVDGRRVFSGGQQ